MHLLVKLAQYPFQFSLDFLDFLNFIKIVRIEFWTGHHFDKFRNSDEILAIHLHVFHLLWVVLEAIYADQSVKWAIWAYAYEVIWPMPRFAAASENFQFLHQSCGRNRVVLVFRIVLALGISMGLLCSIHRGLVLVPWVTVVVVGVSKDEAHFSSF